LFKSGASRLFKALMPVAGRMQDELDDETIDEDAMDGGGV
jgi:hypothetical protein